MMARVIFHVLPASQPAATDSASAELDWICKLAEKYFLAGERVYVACPDQATAEAVDERLFSFEADSFVPHNLQGEGPAGGAPVELGWQPPRGRRSVLINLHPTLPPFALQSALFVELVPVDEQRKAAARERFKLYRSQGHQVETLDLASQPL